MGKIKDIYTIGLEMHKADNADFLGISFEDLQKMTDDYLKFMRLVREERSRPSDPICEDCGDIAFEEHECE